MYLKPMYLCKAAKTNIHVEYRGDLQKLALMAHWVGGRVKMT